MISEEGKMKFMELYMSMVQEYERKLLEIFFMTF